MPPLLIISAAAWAAPPSEPLNHDPVLNVEGAAVHSAARMPMSTEPPYFGVAMQIHQSDGVRPRCRAMMRQIVDLGADTVLISVNAYQQHVDSVLIELDPAVTPTHEELKGILDDARAMGLRSILMPKILLRDPQNGAWRGQIQPPTWTGWFHEYRQCMLRFAHVAQQSGAAVFVIGSELVSTEKHTAQWKQTIAETRRVFSGKLAYSANWDHYRSIQFWDELDLLGVTTYYQLAESGAPDVAQLRRAWMPIRESITSFAQQRGKPLLLTEVGWCSQEGCSIEPWNYYRQHKATDSGIEEQRRNYQAFVEVWSGAPVHGGVIWWEWTDGEGGAADTSYTPKNKPAERVLRDFFDQIRQRKDPGSEK